MRYRFYRVHKYVCFELSNFTSFNQYPDTIPIILNRTGLTFSEIDQITIVSGFPKEGVTSAACKQEHMELARSYILQKSGISIKKENTMLVDDSSKNIQAANDQGYAPGLLVTESDNSTDFSKVTNFIKGDEPPQRHSP